jgi:WD40 repeat protein/tetratricopeptide (TPR) repeat protein
VADLPVVPGYEVLWELGQGGMGVVYAARQTSLGRLVALKMIKTGATSEPDERQRFRTEAEAAARLCHPNIVPIYEVGEHQGQPFLALEHLGGGTLDSRVQGRPQPVRAAAELLAVLARAMQYAHERGVIHRDLKPANILLSAEASARAPSAGEAEGVDLGHWTPKITDFGLAKVAHWEAGRTQSGAILGTPRYMSPEQAAGKGKEVGPATDVYALGAILYELLTGRPPFTGDTAYEILQQVLADEPVPPRRLYPKVPRDLETITLKCLQKEPRHRYLRAGELAEDLHRFLSDQPIQARPTGRAELAWRWCRRNPALAAASTLAVAGMLAVTCVSVLFALSQRRHADEIQEALRIAKENLRRGDVLLAQNYLGRAQTLSEKGSGAFELLLLARALEIAPEDETALQQAIRSKLGIHGLQVHRPSSVLDQPGQVCVAAWSSDGQVLVTGTLEGTARLWSTATGKPLGAPLRHEHRVLSAVLSPDGSTLLTGTTEGTARLWETATGRLIGEPIPHQGKIYTLAFSPDGRTALTAGEEGVARLWQAATGKAIGHPMIQGSAVRAGAFDPEGKIVLTGGLDGTARLWDAATGAPLGKPLPHGNPILAALFSPDGRFFLTASAQTAVLWERASGKRLDPSFPHESGIRAVAFSPDGRGFVTAGADGAVRRWKTATRQLLGEPLKHNGPVSAVAWSPDSALLLTGGDDRLARLWDASTGKPIGLPLQHAGEVWGVRFSPDGRHMLTWGVDDPVRLWRAPPATQASATLSHDQWVTAVAFSQDSTKLFTACGNLFPSKGQLRIWDSATCLLLGPERVLPTTIPLGTLAVSPDGKHCLTGGGNPFGNSGEARLWDVAAGKPLGLPLRHPGIVMASAFSPDGKHCLTGSRFGPARLWQVASGKLLREFPHENGVLAIAFSPDGTRVLTGGEDKTARLWDVKTGQPIGEAFRHQDQVLGVAFSPDGDTILTGAVNETAQLWSPHTGMPLGAPFRHRSWVRSVAFSPDGLTLLTSSGDNTVRLWDKFTRELVATPCQHRSWVFAAALSADGTTVLSGSRDQTARLAPEGHYLARQVVPIPSAGEVERISLWAQVVTGAELDSREVVHYLDARTWQQRVGRLQELGGSPLAPVESAVASTIPLPALLWHQQQAIEARSDRDWFAVAFHLSRLLAARPRLASLHERRGLAHCGLGKIQQAAVDFATARDLQPEECLYAFEHAGALALANEGDGYRRACLRLLERFGQSTDPWVVYTMARCCLLTPQAPTDLARIEKLAVRAASAIPDVGWTHHTLGLASYRAGRFDEAVRRFHKSLQVAPRWEALSANWLGLALAHHRLGQVAEASRWLNKAAAWAAPRKDGPSSRTAGTARPRDVHDLHPHDVLACQLLRREAEALVKGPKP